MSIWWLVIRIFDYRLRKEVRSFSLALEHDLFPKFAELGLDKVEIAIDPSRGVLTLQSPFVQLAPSPLPYPLLTAFFTLLQIRRLVLSVRLESTQLEEVLWLLRRHRREIAEAHFESKDLRDLVSEEGILRWCALARLDLRPPRSLSVTYHYCELIFSRGIRRLTGLAGHRRLFKGGKLLGILAGSTLIAALVSWIAPGFSRWSLALAIAGLACGALSLGLFIVGSLVYDIEHRGYSHYKGSHGAGPAHTWPAGRHLARAGPTEIASQQGGSQSWGPWPLRPGSWRGGSSKVFPASRAYFPKPGPGISGPVTGLSHLP